MWPILDGIQVKVKAHCSFEVATWDMGVNDPRVTSLTCTTSHSYLSEVAFRWDERFEGLLEDINQNI